ncbi:MAG: hypothetical protein O3B97_01080, partial [Actinomycetota bacterium]|nr:hypothetical protein [Actinomycetota bacterium]
MRDEEQVDALITQVHDRAHLGQPFLTRHDALAVHVPAALGPLLVLQDHSRGARAVQQARGARGRQGVAVPGVGVHDHRHPGHRGDQVARGVGDLGLGEVAEVGQAQARCRHRVPGHHQRAESHLRGEAG